MSPDRFGEPWPDDDLQAELEAEYVPRSRAEIVMRCEDIRAILRAKRALAESLEVPPW